MPSQPKSTRFRIISVASVRRALPPGTLYPVVQRQAPNVALSLRLPGSNRQRGSVVLAGGTDGPHFLRGNYGGGRLPRPRADFGDLTISQIRAYQARGVAAEQSPK